MVTIFVSCFLEAEAPGPPEAVYGDGLLNTRWGSNEYEARELDFHAIDSVTFKNGGRVDELSCWYDNNARKGNVALLGDFTISADFQTLTFLSYSSYGHPLDFARIAE